MSEYRNEIKFILNKNDAERLKYNLSLIMDVDKNSINEDNTYFIRSLYFDDLFSTAFYEKVDGIEYRQKYRIRLYNNDKRFIRLECKYKYNYLTRKKQMLINEKICDNLISGSIENIEAKPNTLLFEFITEMKVKHLVPSIVVDYKRLAYTYPISDTRITFDEDVSSGNLNNDIFDPNLLGINMMDKGKVIMEVKFNEILPEHIANVLETVPTFRESFSKFAICRSIK